MFICVFLYIFIFVVVVTVVVVVVVGGAAVVVVVVVAGRRRCCCWKGGHVISSECGASATTTSPCAYDHCHIFRVRFDFSILQGPSASSTRRRWLLNTSCCSTMRGGCLNNSIFDFGW